MLFDNYLIFIYILTVVLVYNGVKRITQNVLIRNLVILASNVLILLFFVKEHTIIVLAVFSIVVYGVGIALQKQASVFKLGLALAFVISLFIIRNYTLVQEIFIESFLSFLNVPILSVQKIGLSYMLFRYIHWLVESNKGTIHKPDFLSFVNYILFFPSVLAGPIDTFNNFRFWVGNSRFQYQKSLFFAGITRIFLGAFKTIGLVPLIIAYATDYKLLLADFPHIAAVSLSLLAYSTYIFLDFSGYSDIAIGTAYMLGIKTPENFNSPYASQNLAEFWRRWHITFSLFLRMYVFKPSIRLYNRILGTKHKLPITVLCYLSTFVVCGLWHGSSLNFVYWGLWHGVGLALNKVWTTYISPNFSFQNSPVYQALSICITFLYVSFGWVFFHYNTAQLAEIAHLFI